MERIYEFPLGKLVEKEGEGSVEVVFMGFGRGRDFLFLDVDGGLGLALTLGWLVSGSIEATGVGEVGFLFLEVSE